MADLPPIWYQFGPVVERVYEPSRIRRGRPSTVPIWYVTTTYGERWRFSRKCDAKAFVDNGCSCDDHQDGVMACSKCWGRCVERGRE